MAPSVENYFGKWFTPRIGLLQGHVNSPDLWNLFIHHVLSEWKRALDKGPWGVPVLHCRDGHIRGPTELRNKTEKFLTRIRYLGYADDLTIFQHGRKRFETAVQELFKKAETYGMAVSCEITKTRTMRVGFQKKYKVYALPEKKSAKNKKKGKGKKKKKHKSM